jgi:phage tail-like protein
MKRISPSASVLGTVSLIALLVVVAVGAGPSDSAVPARFGLELEGQLAGFFDSVENIGSEHDVIKHKIVDEQGMEVEMKTPGNLAWLDITLSRGMSSDDSLWGWRQQIVDDGIEQARMDCSIIAFDRANQELARWNLVEAWPSRLVVPLGGGAKHAPLIEELTLVHQGLTFVD